MFSSETPFNVLFAQSKVYPTEDAGVVVTESGVAWTLGSIVEIVAASTITKGFAITGVTIEAMGAAGTYELVLYYGSGDVECGRIKFTAAGNYPLKSQVIPANSRVRAKLTSSNGSSQTATVAIRYQEF